MKAELDKVIDKIESNAILLGATALEDRLQDKVKRDMDYHAAEMAIIISQTYCLEEGKRKTLLYRQEIIIRVGITKQ